MELIKVNLFDEVLMKKAHPCQFKSKSFQIIKLGADLKMQCLGCGNVIIISRLNFNKRFKALVSAHDALIFKK